MNPAVSLLQARSLACSSDSRWLAGGGVEDTDASTQVYVRGVECVSAGREMNGGGISLGSRWTVEVGEEEGGVGERCVGREGG